MPFEAGTHAPRTIAVVGAGISGMGAAWRLSERHRVVLIEAEPRLGGHARTRTAGRNGDLTVDTGFIVFNHANYPNLVALFDELEVPTRLSDMSFGASFGGGRFEYGLRNLGALLAQPKNALDPRYFRMIRDLLRFNETALEASRQDGLTIGGLCETLGMGPWFRDRYLLPMSGAIWSTPKSQVLDFPAETMMRFFDNHNLLQTSGQHDWYTVEGGSENYVSRLEAAMERRGVEIRTGAPVAGVRRGPDAVRLRLKGGEWEIFDEVVFATHSDDTLAMLEDADGEERKVLGAVRYQPNEVVLHGDTSIMPRSRRAWASWVYTEDAEKVSPRIDLTYWMNSLQRWLTTEQVFVTLNTTREIDESLVWDRTVLRHPVYDLGALAAQKTAREMNGRRSTWFCGAWMRNGFHEDGLASGFDVADAINARSGTAVAAE
ncbi:NAD(P)/FAD-dependent oxidoreductase [Histidinibacterium aquaticum]|uniref:FAD-dependent oxidoreductase n=1 Tax=Histidinibacterium aquaticum TaxID=2613962 RepID=A0A5J5GDD9_9RHOB|nr:FAD-dependent oxidoreductase [Histidinibacterium aquaticum]KAA9006047.1 FAD-dependent oxidoreductase [Histidinibacterium aquaticum]